MTEHSEQLLACDWCGKPPSIVCPDDSYGAAYITCGDANNCPAEVMVSVELREGKTIDDAKRIWNTRSDTALTEALARVRVIEDLLRSIGGVGPFMRARINAALKGTDA